MKTHKQQNTTFNDNQKTGRLRFLSTSILLTVLSSSLVACGDEKTTKNTVQNAKASNTVNATKLSLSTAPINLNDAFYAGPPSFTKIGSCPFLSLETAKKSVHALLPDLPFLPVEVSNERCSWSFDKGIMFDIYIKSLEKGKKDLAWRMKRKSPPLIKPLEGPGTNAIALYNKDFNGKRRDTPSELIFIQNDQHISIPAALSASKRVSLQQLQEVANEISKRLPNAPKIERQTKQIIYKFSSCDIWKTSLLNTLFQTKKAMTAGLYSGGSVCQYLFQGKDSNSQHFYELKFSFFKQKQENCKKSLTKQSYKIEKTTPYTVASKQSFTDKYDPKRGMDSHTVCLDKGTFNISIDGQGTPYTAQLKRLVENVLQRVPAP